MSETAAGFWGGGGGGAYWPKGSRNARPTPVGETLKGTIAAVHPPEPQTDFNTGEPVPGKLQVRIDVQTDLNDPDVDDDDGMRTLYVKGWMTGAITDALKTAGVAEPQVGAELAVTYTGNAAPRRPGIEGAKQYSAVYSPSSGFFAGAGQPAAQAPKNAPIPDDPPKGIDAEAWKSMPHDAKQAIANTIAGMPPF